MMILLIVSVYEKFITSASLVRNPTRINHFSVEVWIIFDDEIISFVDKGVVVLLFIKILNYVGLLVVCVKEGRKEDVIINTICN